VCAEASTVLRAAAADFFFNCWCPRVEAGKNTSTVIPASRKRRRKRNPGVSDETVPADLREG
jgi:hypothetical protein